MPVDRSLRPADAAVALRSFPRRFRGVLGRPDDDPGDDPGDDTASGDPDEIARRIGPDGHSGADHLLAADGIVALLDGTLEEARRGDAVDLTLHPAYDDLTAVTWEDPHTPIAALLDQFEATAARAADCVESVPAERWSAEAPIAGSDRSLTMIDATQDAVGAVSDHLRDAQEVIDAVAGERNS